MSGLFPQGGVTAANTINGAASIVTKPGCPPLFHPARCIPRFDAPAANAVISELVNAINLTQPYDCNKLDNLKTTLQALTQLCGLPITSPDLDDFLAGCFDGADGKISIGALLNVFLSQIPSLCSLPVRAPVPTDYLAGCFGAEGVDAKTQISALIQLVVDSIPGGSAGAPYFRTGEAIPFPQNDTRDTDVFSIADCDGLLFGNPWKMNIGSVGGSRTELMGFQPGGYASISNIFLADTGPGGGYALGYAGSVTMEKLPDGQWYIFSGTRVIMRHIPIFDETKVFATRNEVTNQSPDSSLTKLHKYPV